MSDGQPLFCMSHPRPSLLKRIIAAFLPEPTIDPDSLEDVLIQLPLTAQEEEWNRRLASGEPLFFVTEQAYAAEFAKYSEQA